MNHKTELKGILSIQYSGATLYAFKVTLDEKGKLLWTYSGKDKPEVFTSDPLAKPLDRIIAKIASFLPVKSQM